MGRDTGVPWKLAPVWTVSVLGEEDGVVAHAVQLDLDLAAGVGHRVVGGADDLGGRAHGVGVLDPGLDLAGEQVAARRCTGGWPPALRMAPAKPRTSCRRRFVGLHVGQQGLQRHGRGDLGLLQPAVHVVQVDGAHGRQQVRAVDGGQAVAGLQAGHGNAGPVQGLGAGQQLALVVGLAFAHHQQGDLGHGGQVAAGADRPLLADEGRDALVEHLHQGLGDLRPAARMAVGVHVDASGHGAAHVLDGRRVADAGGVVVDQVFLELAHLVVVQHDLAELADARC